MLVIYILVIYNEKTCIFNIKSGLLSLINTINHRIVSSYWYNSIFFYSTDNKLNIFFQNEQYPISFTHRIH